MIIEKEFPTTKEGIKNFRKFVRHTEFPEADFGKPVVESFIRVIMKDSMHVMDIFETDKKQRERLLRVAEKTIAEEKESSTIVEFHANYRYGMWSKNK